MSHHIMYKICSVTLRKKIVGAFALQRQYINYSRG